MSTCPSCGSQQIRMVNERINASTYGKWFECLNCGYQWPYYRG